MMFISKQNLIHIFRIIFCFTIILGFTLKATEPTTQQLLEKTIRDGGSFFADFADDSEEKLFESLRSTTHRETAQTLLREKIAASTDRDLKNVLKVHWEIFGEEASTALFLQAAKREPNTVLWALSYLRSPKSKPIKKFILDSLASDDPNLRYSAATVPGNHGPDSIPLLIDLLQSTDRPADWDQDDLDTLQKNVLARMEENASLKFIPPLLKLTNHPPSAPRSVKTLIALQNSWDAEAKSQIIKALLKLFKKPSYPARFAAAKALASLGNPAGVGFLLDRMQAETKFTKIDRQIALDALLPLLKENPVNEDAPPWEIDFPKVADGLRKSLANENWPLKDTRTRPDKLTPQDKVIFQALREGNVRLPDFNPSHLQEAEQALASPPAYDRKSPSPAPKFTRLAAVFFEKGDQKKAAQLLDLARQWGDSNDGLVDAVFTEEVQASINFATEEFMTGSEHKALEKLLNLRGAALDLLLTKYPKGKAILEDLKRRKNSKILNRKPPEIPADFDHWPVERRVAFLIDSFDTLSIHQSGYPGGVDFSEDPRVAKLIEIGDPAIPALIDCIEKDLRFTRSGQRWRSHTEAFLLAVREPALLAIMSILRIQVFDHGSTTDNFTRRGQEAAKKMAAQLRQYWLEFGHLSLAERMVHVLQNPDSEPKQLYEAAWNLSTPGVVEVIGTSFGVGGVKAEPKDPKANPAIAQFENPTAAEAMLTAMDRCIVHYRKILEPRDTFEIERFAGCLGNLADPRIVPELEKRWRECTNSAPAWSFVVAAKRCGKSELFDREARAFAEGHLTLKSDGKIVTEADSDHIIPMVDSFLAFDDPVSKKALSALADPKHPFFPAAIKQIANEDAYSDHPWTAHLFWHPIALAALSDGRPTGRQFWLDERGFIRNNPDTGDGMPDWLEALQPKVGKKVPERLQDLAAKALVERVPGLPRYHLLSPDRDERLQRIQFLTKAWEDKMHTPDYDLQDAAGYVFYGHYLFPKLKSLDRPATQEDVVSGRAAFFLKNSKRADLGIKLPAKAELSDGENVEKVVVFQAERTAAGEVLCGILGEHRFESVPLSSLKNLGPIRE